MIRDRNIDWQRKKVYVNAVDFRDSIGVTTTTRVGLGTGVPVAKDLNSLFVAGMLIGAGGADDTGDEFHHYMPVPYDLDPDDEVGIRINWCTASTTDADDVAFVALLAFYAEDAAIIKAAGALDTVIPADLVGTAAAFGNKWTARGIKDAGFLTRAEVENGLALMQWEIRCSVDDPSGDTFLLGVLIDYKVRATKS